MSSALLFLAVAVIGFAAVAGLGLVLTSGGAGSPASKRVQAVTGTAKGERGRAARGAANADLAATRRKQIMQNLKTSEKRRVKMTLDARIAQAGLSISVRTFWLISAGVGAGFATAAVVALHTPLVALGVGFVTGFGLPRWVLGFLCKGRHKKFTAEFPNSIDIVVRGIKSGLPVGECLKVIAAESPEPLGSEFRKLNESLGMGLTMDQAMEKMFIRMPTAEVRFFAIVLAIQQKTGGNLAEALNNLSVVLRSRKLMVEKIKAMSGEAVASAVIIGALPPGIMILVTLTTPAYMQTLYTTSGGHMALGVGATMMAMGVFVMRKMINFKF